MYCTPEDVKTILAGVEKTDSEQWEGTGADINDAEITEDIENADSQINVACAKRYNVPFSPTPEIIKRLSADIAQYLTDMRYRTSREYESQNYPSIMRYNRAKETLEYIRSGDYIIPIEDDTTFTEPVIYRPYPDFYLTTYDEFFYDGRLQY